MANKAYLIVEDSSYGRESSAWLSPGGWFFMFEDGDVRLNGAYVSYHSNVGKCRSILSDRIATLKPVSGQLPCPELVEYLEELLLWLSDFTPATRLLADFGELDEILFGALDEDVEPEDEKWREGAGRDYILPAEFQESYHAYAAFNVGQWMKLVQAGRWDRIEDGLRYIGISDDVWGDLEEGKGIVIGYEVEAPVEYQDDSGTDGPESRRISTEVFLRGT